ncbi:AraC family transcriptional regulator [Stagnihabitans tardus]|uniref:Helix-turn-helix domain-containing protein n=1 Tax=Stagnihabitans tardus TaxID=2699202 RepID=A0AAE5BXX9_9RHOB|nr:AraC family transcriptional regulator [Stagnihabitans tardus]NBZ89808.1 helix-turn-helix domain-containing protein [Stagnihabitans tardus]
MNPGSDFLPLYCIEQAFVRLAADKPVRAQRLEVPEDVPRHDHAFHEICVVTEGTAAHVTKGGVLPLAPGDVFVVPPGEVHGLANVRNLKVINAYYLSEWLLGDLGLLWAEPGAVPLFLSRALMTFQIVNVVQFRLTADELAGVILELDQIEASVEAAKRSALSLRGSFLKIVATLSQAWMRADPSAATIAFRSEVWNAMEVIERAVQSGGLFSVADYARKAGMTADHFSALFRGQTGYGPMDYFQRRRIHRACQMLLAPRLNVTEVATEMGYSDAPHFCRMFKQHMGMTPTRYRAVYQA